MKERIKELEHLIKIHKTMYYKGYDFITDLSNNKIIPISDQEFDTLEDTLRQLDPTNDTLQVVGTNSKGKVHHTVPMKSIKKTKSKDDVNKLKEHGDLIATYKMDGSSCSLKYKDGIFIQAGTRGNGDQGEDITKSLLNIKFPKEIENKDITFINGEVVISKDNFELLRKEMISRGLDEPKSIRNIVAGLLNRKDNKDLCKYLLFIAFESDIKTNNYNDKLFILKELNFPIPEIIYYDYLRTTQDTIDFYITNFEDYSYLTDGIVFRINDNTIYNSLGKTDHHNKGSIAYKISDEKKITTIKDIISEVGRTGKVSFVGNIKEVYLSEAVINRVTLHNAKYCIDHGIWIGSEIEIVRSNKIIPKHISTIKRIDDIKHLLPINCPVCNSELEWSDTNTDLLCTNPHCKGKEFKKLVHFAKVIGIEGLAESTMKKLYDNGYVEKFSDIFDISANAFLNIEGFQKKSAKKLYESIQSHIDIPMNVFLSSLSVEGLGKTTSKLIEDKYKNIDTFLNETDTSIYNQLLNIDGIGDTIAKSISNSIGYIEMIYQSLKELNVSICTPTPIITTESIYTGKSFIISGATDMGKKEIYKIIESLGGLKVSTVKRCSILITNDTITNKYKDAIKYDKEVMNEEEFLNSIK